MTTHEALDEILRIARATHSPAWVVANALRALVNPDLGQAAMAIASIEMEAGTATEAELSYDEAPAAVADASIDMADAAERALSLHRITELRPIDRPSATEGAPI